jgi:hypothetical protein
MSNYISFSLFGSMSHYVSGAIENAKKIKEIYPEWRPIFFYSKSIKSTAVEKLRNLGSEVVLVDEPEDFRATLWRYRAVYLKDAELVIFRDTDSLVSHREASAVAEWVSSGKDLHIIRDHPFHTEAIMGGMWGVKARAINSDKDLFSPLGIPERYGVDQILLRARVYRNKNLSRLVHDSWFVREFNSRLLPPSIDHSFIGEVKFQNSASRDNSASTMTKHQMSQWSRFVTQLWSIAKIFRDYAHDLVVLPKIRNTLD